jgi:predicted TIM-barrel fold metal-dependent hydrolase
VPQARFILTEYRIQGSLTDEDGKPLYPNLYIEISRLRSAYMQDLAKLAEALGSDHLLFGSGAPFKEVSPAILKMECADLSVQEKAKINGLNAQSLFSL